MTAASPACRDPLLRLLGLARPLRGQLLLAVAAGAAATGCGVALLAVSGFLLARASQHPNIVAISVAVVAVRGLSVGRGVFRYVERLASHDAAFRILADVRVSIYRRLRPARPGRAGGLHLRGPAGAADLRCRCHAGLVHQGHHAAARRGAGRRRGGHRLPADPGTRRRCPRRLACWRPASACR